MREAWASLPFGELYAEPSRNGVSVPKAQRGAGSPMVNMRELFAHDVISDQATELVPLPPESLAKWRLRDGDLLFGRRSLTLEGAGKCSIVVTPSHAIVFESSLIRVRLDPDRACPRFFFYLFKSRLGRTLIETIVEQVAVAGIRSSDLARLQVPVPPIKEQRRIAGVLGALDDLIDTNRRIAEDCTALWRAIVRDALADASESAPLSELADFVNGKNFTKRASGHGRPVIRTPEVRRGPEAGTVRSDADAADENLAREGDTLFVWSGSLMVGRWLWEEGLINQHVFKVLPKPGVPAWLVFALIEYQMPWFLSLAADKATTMGHIKREHLDAVVPVPLATDVKRLGAIVEPLWNEALQCGIAAQELTRARDELLPLLLSGRVRVEDVAA